MEELWKTKDYPICATCGEAGCHHDTGLCVNGHDDWIEMSDTVPDIIEASVKLGVTVGELVEAMKTGKRVMPSTIPDKRFTVADLEKAYQAGRRQMIGEWTNDLGGKDPEGDKDFDDWYNETYPAKNSEHQKEQS
jgi:hypothetical protein